MALMLSPDGSEVFDVPDSMVAHYQAKGAILSRQGGQDAPQGPGLGERIGQMPLLPLMPGSPRIRDAAWALPVAGGMIPGPIGAAGATGGELARQSLAGEDVNPAQAAGAGVTALAFGQVPRLLGALRGAGNIPGLRKIPFLNRAGDVVADVAQAVTKPGRMPGLMSASDDIGRAGATPVPAPSPMPAAAGESLAGLGAETPQQLQAIRKLLLKRPAASAYSKLEGILPEPPSKIAGSIKPKVSRGTSAAKPLPKSADTVPIKAPKPLSKAAKATKGADTAVSRHEVQYYSESKGVFEPIEDMSISHIRNAMNKLHAKIGPGNKATPVARKQLQALKDEVTHRMRQTGERTVPGPVGKAQQAVADKFEDDALARVTGKIAGEISPLAKRLEQSLAFEKILTQRGFTEAQKRALRRSATEMIQGGTQ